MKSKILIFVSFLLATISVGAQNYVTLYSDCDYRGSNQSFKEGRYYLNQTRIGGRNLSSIRIPRGMKVVLYTGDNPGTGEKTRFNDADVTCLGSYGWNDKAVTMVVENTGSGNNGNNNNNGWNNSDRDKVIGLVNDADYKGDRIDYAPGFYNLRNSTLNRNVTSILVRPGYVVTAYDQPNQKGNSYSFRESNPNLKSVGWNDRIQSIEVRKD